MLGPYFFITCNLVQPPESTAPQPQSNALVGTVVSSLHRLKNTDNKEGAFFVFGDLSVRPEGQFALQFNLYEIRDQWAVHLRSILSEKFTVQGPKVFPGLNESTPLTRSFSEQGVRLRVRKEPRLLLRKRGPSCPNYIPRKYQNRDQLKNEDREDASGSPGSSRHSQAETIQAPLEGQQSSEGYDSNIDELQMKRPRTGSEHSHFSHHTQPSAYALQSQQVASFGQQRPQLLVKLPVYFDGERWNKKSNRRQTHSSYPQQLPLGLYAGPPHAYSPGGYRVPPYFPQQFNPQQGMDAQSYDPSAHAYFPPQPQTQYQHPQGYDGQSAPSFQPYGMIDDGSRQPGMGEADMGPPQYHRMTPNAGFGSTIGHQGDIRSGYVVPIGHGYPQFAQNISSDSMRSPSVPITSGPGALDKQYQ